MHQKWTISVFFGKSHSNPLNPKLEKRCFLGGSWLETFPQTSLAFSKRAGNNWKRKRKPRTFQNFKNYEKILIIKKVTSILVSFGAIFTCLSVIPTFPYYNPYFYLVKVRNVVMEGRIYGRACKNSSEQH